jgi:NADPH-ferrihemoprotein reductase
VYKTAANLAIFPKNSDDDVLLCAKRLGFDLDTKFVLVHNPKSTKKGTVKHPFPTPITVREALEYFVDLRGPIRKKTLKDLSECCRDETEKNRLK